MSTESSQVADVRRPLRIKGIAALVALLGAAATVFVLARGRREEPSKKDPTRDVPHLDGSSIRFSAEFRTRSGITYGVPEAASISPVIHVTGTVTFNPQRVAAIGTRISGRVRRVLRFEGDTVKPGDVLAEIERAELGQAQTAVLSSRAHAEAADANEKRESDLAKARVTSQRDAELAKATAAAARAELFAAEQRVRALGGGTGASEIGVLALTSPIGGKVVEHHVSRGQSVEPSFTAFRVADLSRVWIELAVFERDLGHLKEGDPVDISPQTNTSSTLSGKVAHVGDVIDLDTRSAPVRVVADNEERLLRPGQSVLAKIHTAGGKSTALLVPRDSVTSVDGRSTLFVVRDETSVEPRSVLLGGKDGLRVEVVGGLKDNERIVTGGVFALKSEVFR